jgi:hypothetical protein
VATDRIGLRYFPDTLTPGIAAGVGLALILVPLIWRRADRDG